MVGFQLQARVPMPVRAGPLLNWLSIYPHPPSGCFMVKGFNYLVFAFLMKRREKKHCFGNLKLVHGMEDMVRGKLRKEMELGQICRPHVKLCLPNLQISPLGIVPKKVQDEFRLRGR